MEFKNEILLCDLLLVTFTTDGSEILEKHFNKEVINESN